MPRIARMIVEGEAAVYHVVSRTALDGFVLGDVEKDFLFGLIKRLSNVYFAEVLGLCIMGNHFHIVTRMLPGDDVSDEEIRKRFALYYVGDPKRELLPGQIPSYRQKWSRLSEFLKEIKQGFSRFYNKRHKRKGFFWSDRFKSVIVEDGETLINCLAYVDLNPVRAGIVERPEEYRWNCLGYHLQTANKDNFLSLDFGLTGSQRQSKAIKLAAYRQFVYEKGSLLDSKRKIIIRQIYEKEKSKNFTPSAVDRFLCRTRYFVDSGIIGTKAFVKCLAERFLEEPRRQRQPKRVIGLEGVYSMKRLSEIL